MNKREQVFKFFQSSFLSDHTREKSEAVIVRIAIISFILHLLLIVLLDFDIIQLKDYPELLAHPIAAIYTPFSFILIYEVYLLVYYLPKSTTIYIGKQYEIITLILIRRIFKDLSKLEFTSDWFNEKNDLQFTYDLIATIALFFLIYIFYRLDKQRKGARKKSGQPPLKILRFIRMKNVIAICLVPIFLVLAIYSLVRWIYRSFFSISQVVDFIKDVNIIFFDEFFTILILIDVLLLLISFLHTDKFSKVIRNSGFIISTILIKLSFGAEGFLNTILIVIAVLFGVIILAIHNQYEKLEGAEDS